MHGLKTEQITIVDKVKLPSSMHFREALSRIKQAILTCLVVAAAMFSLSAAEHGFPAVGKKVTSWTVMGRIVFVDKALRTVAVEVRGKILQLKVPARANIAKGGKPAAFADLAGGEEATIGFRQDVEGRSEVVSLSIGGTGTHASTDKTIKASRPATPPELTQGGGNPANLVGGVHSPNK